MNKVKVYLRKKNISNNKQSLYLDFSPAIINPVTRQMTRRYFLSLYLQCGDKLSLQEKQDNEESEKRAQLIKGQISNQIFRDDFSFFYGKSSSVQISLDTYLSEKKSASNGKIIAYMLVKLDLFLDLKAKELSRRATFQDLTTAFCNQFRDFLMNDTITQNTASRYFYAFKELVRDAVNKEYATANTETVKNIKILETHKEFLAWDEVQQLAQTEMTQGNEVIKRAAMFSIFTGLRCSDVIGLQWKDIVKKDNGFIIQFRQQKTQFVETLPINENALFYCGQRRNDNDTVFEGFTNNSTDKKYMQIWIALAGIRRHITFHCFRHTHATLLVNKGVDIYTVSKMLGHKSVKTTQIYAKITDAKKRDAAQMLNLDTQEIQTKLF